MRVSQLVLPKLGELCEHAEEIAGKTGEVPFPTLPWLVNDGGGGRFPVGKSYCDIAEWSGCGTHKLKEWASRGVA